MKTSEIIGLVFLVVLCLVLIVCGPLAIIWALNTLFMAAQIPYNFWSWLAVVVLNLSWAYKPSQIIKK